MRIKMKTGCVNLWTLISDLPAIFPCSEYDSMQVYHNPPYISSLLQ